MRIAGLDKAFEECLANGTKTLIYLWFIAETYGSERRHALA